MAAPTAPALAEPDQPALIRAANTAAALELVAQRFERPRAELARTLTRRDLEQETARAIIAYAREEAARLLRDEGDIPQGEDAISVAVRTSYQRLKAARDAAENAAADRALRAEMDG